VTHDRECRCKESRLHTFLLAGAERTVLVGYLDAAIKVASKGGTEEGAQWTSEHEPQGATD
jgi:hypothetical protein